ncbi:MAG: DUF3858 domain-containing protein, partial [Cyclobacteriaceae bacterium]|nr:DUF3858 domain-containing protein [Cyclobacteriaceae bacterium]
STFNHAILTVPVDRDTIWLECTSQTSPFGYMGTFTSDRDALLIEESGAKIIHTRVYDETDNVQASSYAVLLNKDGTGAFNFNRIYTGIETENDGFSRIALDSEKDQIDWFYEKHKWGKIRIDSFLIQKPQGDIVPSGSLHLEGKLDHAGKVSGNRLFFQPFQFTNSSEYDIPDIERKVPIEIRYGFTQVDTINVKFPDEYVPERLLENTELISKFGLFSTEVQKDKNAFLFIRKFTLYKGRYAPEDYVEFRDFIKLIQRADRKNIVFINKT